MEFVVAYGPGGVYEPPSRKRAASGAAGLQAQMKTSMQICLPQAEMEQATCQDWPHDRKLKKKLQLKLQQPQSVRKASWPRGLYAGRLLQTFSSLTPVALAGETEKLGKTSAPEMLARAPPKVPERANGLGER